MTTKLKLTIRQGETFQRIIRWEKMPYVYVPITAIVQAAPVKITAPGHGLADGWRSAVVSVEGMEEINAPHMPPRENEFHQITLLGPDLIAINDINASGFSAYKKGGYLQFFTPQDLTDYTAKADIKDRVGGTVLLSMSTENGRIAIDPIALTIVMTVDAMDLAADVLTWTSGVWDLEMKHEPTGQKTTLYFGSVSVKSEVTTAE